MDHGNGVTSLYGHLSERNVKAGDKVKAGSRVGLSGNTGNSTGAHLHLEIRENGKPVNPANYVGMSKITFSF